MLGVTWWDSLLITAVLSNSAFPLPPHRGIQAESTGTAGGYFYNRWKRRASYFMTRCSLEIVPPPVCPQRVRDDASCDCSTRRCRRKGDAIASLLQQEVPDTPHAQHRTHPLICHHLLLTQVLDLGVPIMVLLSCTGTLTGIAGGLADGRPGAGEDYAPLAGGFPNRLLPPSYGLGGVSRVPSHPEV